MEKNNCSLEKNSCYSEISRDELRIINGGRFAYDFGFFLREMGIYIGNGGGTLGNIAVVYDLSINYNSLD